MDNGHGSEAGLIMFGNVTGHYDKIGGIPTGQILLLLTLLQTHPRPIIQVFKLRVYKLATHYSQCKE